MNCYFCHRCLVQLCEPTCPIRRLSTRTGPQESLAYKVATVLHAVVTSTLDYCDALHLGLSLQTFEISACSERYLFFYFLSFDLWLRKLSWDFQCSMTSVNVARGGGVLFYLASILHLELLGLRIQFTYKGRVNTILFGLYYQALCNHASAWLWSLWSIKSGDGHKLQSCCSGFGSWTRWTASWTPKIKLGARHPVAASPESDTSVSFLGKVSVASDALILPGSEVGTLVVGLLLGNFEHRQQHVYVSWKWWRHIRTCSHWVVLMQPESSKPPNSDWDKLGASGGGGVAGGDKNHKPRVASLNNSGVEFGSGLDLCPSLVNPKNTLRSHCLIAM